ncbi:MAG TPA: GNAT family N-acetyltransferase [Pyrinomonadaceae bacterium]|nr:GNAT family N-acetyltransferase [Pyrinomonadaceae bacterium]
MNVTIRLATIKDIPTLETLIVNSVTLLSSNYYTPKQIESGLAHVFGVDSQLIADSTYFIAELENQIAGAGGWSKRKTLFGGDQRKGEQPDPLLDPLIEPARIRAFYIDPHWSRRGIGTALLQACEDAARRNGFNRVELAATLPGVPFYLARGYESGEPIRIETPDGEWIETIRMSCDLTP